MTITVTQPQLHETSPEQQIPTGQFQSLYDGAKDINRLSEPLELPETFKGRLQGLTISSAGNLPIIYDGDHYDKVESRFWEPGTGPGSDLLGSLYLLNGKVQVRLDFRPGTIQTTRQMHDGKWTSVRPLDPDQFEELHKILDEANKVLLGRKVISKVKTSD